MDRFTEFNYDMNRAGLKNLKKRVHEIQSHQTWLINNSIREQMEKAFRETVK